MMNDRLTELLSRKLSGEATDSELQELHHWLQSNPGDQYFAEILHTYWQHNRTYHYFQDHTPDQHFAHILEMASGDAGIATVRPSSSLLRRIGRIAVAAAVSGAMIAGVWALLPPKRSAEIAGTPKRNEVVAGPGIRSKMVLPDGTQVWLNSDSKLEYNEDFSGTTREVLLEGEAFFDVAKDSAHPFIVHTSTIDIKVLGTSFNVKSYPREKTIETTLIHGSIEVINKKKPDAPKIILRPKEKLVFNKDEEVTGDSAVSRRQKNEAAVDLPAIAIMALPRNIADTSLSETSWVYNRLQFEDELFRDVALKMERWYDIKISFKTERVANYRMTGSFDQENIEEALNALQYVAPFRFKINNNEVEIYGRK